MDDDQTASCCKVKLKPRGPRIRKITKAEREALDEETPDCIYWSTGKVAHWICKLGFPQYQVLTDFPSIVMYFRLYLYV